VRLLRGLGYQNVRHYPGGIAEWRERGLPLEGASAAGRSTGSGPAAWLARALMRLADRSFAWLLGAWLSVTLGSGLLFWLLSLLGVPVMRSGDAVVDGGWTGILTSLYFSFVTATSVGFGDVVPIGVGRVIAVLEAAAGLLVFGCVVSKLVSARQEELTEDIHRVTFEDRLSRVRTSLHLAVSELRALATEADGSTSGDATRLEAVVLLLAGELRAVHDLLNRPRIAPDVEVVEAILAVMAAALEALAELVRACPDTTRDMPLLSRELATVRRLAGEICGECVPADHPPQLDPWLDRIHAVSSQLLLHAAPGNAALG
jgi:potassium channel LctB